MFTLSTEALELRDRIAKHKQKPRFLFFHMGSECLAFSHIYGLLLKWRMDKKTIQTERKVETMRENNYLGRRVVWGGLLWENKNKLIKQQLKIKQEHLTATEQRNRVQ